MTKKPAEMTQELARTIARAFDVSLFERKSSYSAKSDAQGNLSGRTHYADDSTLKFFYSRISSGRAIEHGTVYMLVESVAGDFQNKTRGFRFVAFDLTGRTINDRRNADVETLHKTSARAEREMWEWAESFNVAAHYKERLSEESERAKRRAADMAAAAKQIKI